VAGFEAGLARVPDQVDQNLQHLVFFHGEFHGAVLTSTKHGKLLTKDG
jgi:hypothetical protein